MPRLLQPVDRNDERRRLAAWVDSWDGVDRGLFEQFCELRRARSVALGVPPCIVFNDCALRDMARRRPVTVSELLQVHGVGEKKSVKFGPEFVRCIGDNCARQSVAMDQISSQRTNIPYASGVTKSSMAVFPCFDSGCSVEQVSLQFGRSHPRSMDIWTIYPTATHHGSICVGGHGETAGRVGAAADKLGTERLKPIYDRLGGQVGYGQIRIIVACFGIVEAVRFESVTL